MGLSIPDSDTSDGGDNPVPRLSFDPVRKYNSMTEITDDVRSLSEWCNELLNMVERLGGEVMVLNNRNDRYDRMIFDLEDTVDSMRQGEYPISVVAAVNGVTPPVGDKRSRFGSGLRKGSKGKNAPGRKVEFVDPSNDPAPFFPPAPAPPPPPPSVAIAKPDISGPAAIPVMPAAAPMGATWSVVARKKEPRHPDRGVRTSRPACATPPRCHPLTRYLGERDMLL